MSRDDGGPAFPGINAEFTGISSEGEERYESAPSGGMTLRDHFAGQELAKMHAVDCCDIPEAYERLAEHCYRMADAMLAERAK